MKNELIQVVERLKERLRREAVRRLEIEFFVIRHDPLLGFIGRNLSVYMKSRGMR